MKFFDVLLKQKLAVPIYKSKIDEEYFETLFADWLSGGAGVITTLTGNPLSFLAKKAQKAISTKSSFSPTQDFNGYQYPWDGGCGKNLFNKDDESEAINMYIGVSNNTLASASGVRSVCIKCKPNTTYTISKSVETARFLLGYISEELAVGVVCDDVVRDDSAQSLTITTGENATYLISYLMNQADEEAHKDEILASVQIEENSSATAYAPYSNICLISGRTSVSLNGCGKNLFSGEVYADDSYINEYYNIISNDKYKIYKISNMYNTITLSLFDSNTADVSMYIRAKFYDKNDVELESARTILVSYRTPNDNKISVTFTFPQNSAYVILPLRNSTYNVQIEEGSSATEYESYQQSNAITITFPALGKNLFNKATVTPNSYFDADGNIRSVANTSISDYIEVLPNVTYYFNQWFTQNVARYFCYYDANKNFLDKFHPNYNGEAIAMPSNVKYIRASIRNEFVDTFQVEKGSTATTYEPYTNTCYGGTLDVETGVLTVDKAIVTIKNYDWIYDDSSGGFFKYAFSSKKRNDAYIISTVLRYSGNTASNMPPYSVKQGASSYPTRIIIKMPSGVTTKGQLFELIGNEKIVFNLNTPTTIQLTPNEVQLLKGVNNLWTDGDEIELTYRA